MKGWRVAYYIFNILLSVEMLASAYAELARLPDTAALFAHLGYPPYLLSILGVAKILGVIGIWQSVAPFLREWAYAGFAIDVSGGILSFIFVGDPIGNYAITIASLALVCAAYGSFKKQLS